jgi:hypothetical protein
LGKKRKFNFFKKYKKQENEMKKARIIILIQVALIAGIFAFSSSLLPHSAVKAPGQDITGLNLAPDRPQYDKTSTAGKDFDRVLSTMHWINQNIDIIASVIRGERQSVNIPGVEKQQMYGVPVYLMRYKNASNEEMVRLIAATDDADKLVNAKMDVILSNLDVFVSLPLDPDDISKTAAAGIEFNENKLLSLINRSHNPITRLDALVYMNKLNEKDSARAVLALINHLNNAKDEQTKINTASAIISIGDTAKAYLEKQSLALQNLIEAIELQERTIERLKTDMSLLGYSTNAGNINIRPIDIAITGAISDIIGLTNGYRLTGKVDQRGLEIIKGDFDVMADLLDNKEPLIREAACLALSQVGPEAFDVIAPILLNDPSERVREIAYESIKNMGKGVLPKLENMLSEPNTDSGQKEIIESIITHINDSSAERTASTGFVSGLVKELFSMNRETSRKAADELIKQVTEHGYPASGMVSLLHLELSSFKIANKLPNNDLLVAQMNVTYIESIILERKEPSVKGKAIGKERIEKTSRGPEVFEKTSTTGNYKQKIEDISNSMRGSVTELFSNPDEINKEALEMFGRNLTAVLDSLRSELTGVQREENISNEKKMEIAQAQYEVDKLSGFSGAWHIVTSDMARFKDIMSHQPDVTAQLGIKGVKEQKLVTIGLNKSDFPEKLVELLEKDDIYRELLENTIGVKVTFTDSDAFRSADLMQKIAISSTPIEGVKYRIDIPNQLGYIQSFERMLIIAKAGLSKNKDAAYLLYNSISGKEISKDAWEKVWESFMENGVLKLELPAPVPVDEQYYDMLYRQALLALISA